MVAGDKYQGSRIADAAGEKGASGRRTRQLMGRRGAPGSALLAGHAAPGCFGGRGRLLLLLCLLCCLAWPAGRAAGDRLFAPDCLWERGIVEKTDSLEIANTHLQIPYRDDGALDSSGRFTTFADPGAFFDAPGLNCSGLVLSVCRFLFDRNWSIEEVGADRQGNSGQGSSLGKDWDFGWDLILNLTEGSPRSVVMPDKGTYSLANADGQSLRGFSLHDQAAWHAVLGQMRPGRVYLGSISKPTSKPGYRLLHYHVVLLLPDDKGGVWLYHATHRSNVHRINVNTAKGLGRFMSQFASARGEEKKILLVEAELPRLRVTTATGPEDVEAARRPEAQDRPAGQLEGSPTVQAPVAPEPPADASPDGRSARKTDSVLPEVSTESPASSGRRGTEGEGMSAPSREAVINHLAGKVFKPIRGVNSQVPKWTDNSLTEVKLSFQNWGTGPRDLDLLVKGPEGQLRFKGAISDEGRDLTVNYPTDFGKKPTGPLKLGEYRLDARLDGVPWLADVFEIAAPREASPKLLRVTAPATVQAGKTFTVRVEAQNTGAESDYGGITVSCPDSSGLKLRTATPGRIYPAGSTVLSVTSDRIRTKVPMAERWIELWGENASYDLNLKLDAGRPGTYALYVRCALRGVNVKSSVILMDPRQSESVDQQGFPVYVHRITVQ